MRSKSIFFFLCLWVGIAKGIKSTIFLKIILNNSHLHKKMQIKELNKHSQNSEDSVSWSLSTTSDSERNTIVGSYLSTWNLNYNLWFTHNTDVPTKSITNHKNDTAIQTMRRLNSRKMKRKEARIEWEYMAPEI